MTKTIRENRSKFLRIKCPDCEHEQLVFEKASSKVECIVCGHVLAKPTGGKANIKADVIASYE
ncbi:MAG: 30S ribosomal protein S27e [Methanocalculaceae archaeon]|jgi:small subunit ribosomal protein S27e|nr:30S ribosomal protein S27e [Methanocalculaceae archaeon]